MGVPLSMSEKSARKSVRTESTMMSEASSSKPAPMALAYVVGIDIGMESCLMCCLTMEKRQVIKPSQFSNNAQGFGWLFDDLERLGSSPGQILVGLEATSRYGENLYHALLKRGYRVCLLHPGQIHAFAQQRGLRAKRTGWMRRPLHGPCSAAKRALGMSLTSK